MTEGCIFKFLYVLAHYLLLIHSRSLKMCFLFGLAPCKEDLTSRSEKVMVPFKVKEKSHSPV